MISKTPVSKRRLWLMRVFAMLFVPLLIFICLEAGLRLAGYGFNPSFFRRVQINGRQFYVPNEKFSYRFFPPALARTPIPVGFPVRKPTNSYRIFLLGESAAEGDPDPSYGVGRYLQVLLRERYPGTEFNVVCVAITAIDSNVILPIARECARHQGDLWVIYMGNNEMVGPFGAETTYGLPAPPLKVIRTLLAVKTTRIGQLLDAAARWMRRNASTPQKWGGMPMFMNSRVGYNDSARLRAYANFRANLENILRAAQKAGVPVILSTVAVNLKDCAPFASLHSPNLKTNQELEWDKLYKAGKFLENASSNQEALALYEKAATIDPQYADLQFRMGMTELALTNYEQAYHDFELARDNDALDFRADTRINSAIREAVSRNASQGVHLVDAVKVFANHSPDGIPGLNLFYEHVHLNFAGNYLLALTFAKEVSNLLPVAIREHDKGYWASSEMCDRCLAVTAWDRQRVWQPIFKRITAPPFTGQFNHAAILKLCDAKWAEAKSQAKLQSPEEARRIYEQALAMAPDDYYLHGDFEQYLEAEGDLTQAIVEAKRCCELVPQLPGGFYYTGTLLVRVGHIDEANKYFLKAIAIRHNYCEAQSALGEILTNQQKTGEAIKWFKRAIRSNPNYAQAYVNLGFLQRSLGKSAAAMANFQKAAALEPEGPADYFNRARIADALGRSDEAIACLRGVVKAKPDFWQAHYLLGLDLAAKWETHEARNQFADAIRYRPDFADAHYQLGIMLMMQAETNQALSEFRATLKLDPANSAARQRMEVIHSPTKHNE